MSIIELVDLEHVMGGAQRGEGGDGGEGGGRGINFDTPEGAIGQVRRRAAVCRALHAETQRLSGGRDPRPGTDAYAMQMATQACWRSIGR